MVLITDEEEGLARYVVIGYGPSVLPSLKDRHIEKAKAGSFQYCELGIQSKIYYHLEKIMICIIFIYMIIFGKMNFLYFHLYVL